MTMRVSGAAYMTGQVVAERFKNRQPALEAAVQQEIAALVAAAFQQGFDEACAILSFQLTGELGN